MEARYTYLIRLKPIAPNVTGEFLEDQLVDRGAIDSAWAAFNDSYDGEKRIRSIRVDGTVLEIVLDSSKVLKNPAKSLRTFSSSLSKSDAFGPLVRNGSLFRSVRTPELLLRDDPSTFSDIELIGKIADMLRRRSQDDLIILEQIKTLLNP